MGRMKALQGEKVFATDAVTTEMPSAISGPISRRQGLFTEAW